MFGRVGPTTASYQLLGSGSDGWSENLQSSMTYGRTSVAAPIEKVGAAAAPVGSSARSRSTRSAGDAGEMPGAGATPVTGAPSTLTLRPSSARDPPAARHTAS